MATATSKRKALAISGRNLTAAQKAKQRNDAAGKFADAAVGSENAGLVMVEQFVRYLTTGATVKDTAKALGDSVKARGISNPSVYTSRAINGASVCVALGVLPSEANDVELSAIRNARLVTGPNGDQDERREDIAALVNAVRGGVAPDKALKELKASRKPAEDKDGPHVEGEPSKHVTTADVPEVPEGDAFDADDFASEVSYVIAALDSMPRADVAVIRKEAQRLLTACKAVLS